MAAFSPEVEQRIRDAGELIGELTLQATINADKIALGDVTHEKIKNFIGNIRVLFSQNSYDIGFSYDDLSEEYRSTIRNIIEAGKQANWFPHGIMMADRLWCNRINLDGIVILRAYWGGVHPCPICYTGSDAQKAMLNYRDPIVTGASDWFFYHKYSTPKFMHIGDQVLHEIAEHGFFQSVGSPYRVDPTAFANFFKLRSYTPFTLSPIPKEKTRYRMDMMKVTPFGRDRMAWVNNFATNTTNYGNFTRKTISGNQFVLSEPSPGVQVLEFMIPYPERLYENPTYSDFQIFDMVRDYSSINDKSMDKQTNVFFGSIIKITSAYEYAC